MMRCLFSELPRRRFEMKIDTISPMDTIERFEDGPDDHFYYFAYGSNLFTERLHILNPSAVYVCNGLINGFRLDFSGDSKTWGGAAATVVEDKNRTVCGVVWKLSREHCKTLDMQEWHYRKLYVDVKIIPPGDENVTVSNGHTGTFNTIRCRTYQMLEEDDEQLENKPPHLPSPYYKGVILAGSKEHRLPSEYHEFLESIQDNGYAGPVYIHLSIFEGNQN